VTFGVVAPTAVFGVPTAKLGLVADAWTLRRLAMLAGGGVARRVMLAAQQVTAAEALACGLADAEGDLSDAIGLATHCTELAPMSIGYSKRVLNDFGGSDRNEAWEEEEFERCWVSADFAEGTAALVVGLFGASVYGGYFGAAQGVIYLALLSLLLVADLQVANAIKNVLAAVLFMVFADPDWAVVGLIAVGAVVGGRLGSTVGRKLPPAALRAVIVVVGALAIVRVLWR